MDWWMERINGWIIRTTRSYEKNQHKPLAFLFDYGIGKSPLLSS